jgi:hypothetical protein
MSNTNENINRELGVAIRKLAGTHNADKLTIADCLVDSVDIASRTCSCTPLNDTSIAQIQGVRFQSTVDDGVILQPAIGSTVTVLLSTRVAPLIISYSELDEVYIVAPQVQFNQGNLGGMVKVIDLKIQLNTLQTEINTLKTLVGTAITVYSGILDGGVSAATFNAAQLPQIDLSTIENKAIIQ